MKTVYLHGSFGKEFGHEWSLNVKSPAEAIRAININTDNRFMDHVHEQELAGARFSIVTVTPSEREKLESFTSRGEFDPALASSIFSNEMTAYCSSSKNEFHFVPVVEGEAFLPALIIAGAKAAVVAAGSMSLSTFAFYALGAMAIGAISNMLFPSPEQNDETRKTKSYLFDDRPNITKQGAPVPVGYGMLKIGSNTLSFTRVNKDKHPNGTTDDMTETFTEYTVTDILSEGPIEGLCDMHGRVVNGSSPNLKGLINNFHSFDENMSLKSIYLNEIPVMEPGGSLNFILNEGQGAGTATGLEDQPQCSLGYMDQTENRKGQLLPFSEIETQGQAELPGPSSDKATTGAAILDGAKLFAYPVTARGVGQLKITLSPQAMYNNWTETRNRRGFLGMGARMRVDRGTDAVAITIGAKIKYGRSTCPLISPLNGFGGSEGGTGWETTGAGNRKITKTLGIDHRVPEDLTQGEQNNLARVFLAALFEDLSQAFERNNGIRAFCKEYKSVIDSTDLLNGSVEGGFFEVADAAGTFPPIAPRTFKQFVNDYCNGYRLNNLANNVRTYSKDDTPSVNKTGALLVHLYSQIRSGAGVEELSHNNYDDIMSTLKSASLKGFRKKGGHNKILGSDGYFYDSTHVGLESKITVKTISTSPAGLNLQTALPYFGPSENLILNLVRLTKEIVDPQEQTTTSNRINLSGISSVTTLMGKPLRYQHPGAAMIKIPFDAVNFPQLPERNYLVKLKKVPVPENYNPRTRKYYRAWNGLFKGQRDGEGYSEIGETSMEWTDNPAWILVDMLLNQRFGVGTFGFTLNEIDIWTLYATAKFCDELVETGFPLEHPKRSFTSTQAAPTKSEFLDESHTFDIEITSTSSNVNSEFNGAAADSSTYSAGKKVAFFMDDGSFEERELVSVVGQTLILAGPSFADHPSSVHTDGNYLTSGQCVLSESYPILEPRFSASVLFSQREEALRVIKEICTIFRSVLVYSAGKVSLTTEKKKDPSMMFTDANVSKEGFSYAGAPKNSRVTAAKVRFADKYDNFRSKVEYYEDSSGIDKFGYNLNEVIGVGCTSRGQAKRIAKFMVLAPGLENEYVTFETGMEAALLAPGSILEISDSRRYGENVNGRLKSIHKNTAAGGSVVVDKLLGDLLFYDPEDPGSNKSRVELAVVCGKGFEFSGVQGQEGSLYQKMKELTGGRTQNFTSEEQLSMISGISRPQVAYFDGIIGEDKRSIVSLKSKRRFACFLSTNMVSAEAHGLENEALVGFTSFGTLPSPLQYGEKYKVFASTVNTFKVKAEVEVGGSSTWVDVEFSDIGFSDRGNADDTNFVPSTPGGEHFYYAIDSAATNSSLDQIGPGAVWSIRGYHRDVLRSIQQIPAEDLVKIDTYLGGSPIENSGYSYSERIGRYKVSSPLYSSDGDNETASVSQVSTKGVGLGGFSFLIPKSSSLNLADTHYKAPSDDSAPGGWIKSSRFGWMLELSKNNFRISQTGVNLEEGSVFITRINQDSDIFVFHGASSSTLNIGNDSQFVISSHSNQKYIRTGGGSVYEEEVSSQGSVTAPTDSANSAISNALSKIALDINSFKNVGRIQYRVMSVSESEAGKYRIRASEYNKDKFEIIEKELNIQKPLFPIPPQHSMNVPKSPSNLIVTSLSNPIAS
jgi:predicted phage tail protein